MLYGIVNLNDPYMKTMDEKQCTFFVIQCRYLWLFIRNIGINNKKDFEQFNHFRAVFPTACGGLPPTIGQIGMGRAPLEPYQSKVEN